jgi:hypothetical protein
VAHHTVHGHLAAEAAGELTDEVQSQSHSTMGSRGGLIDLRGSIEDASQISGRDPRAFVAHADHQRVAHDPSVDQNGAPDRQTMDVPRMRSAGM